MIRSFIDTNLFSTLLLLFVFVLVPLESDAQELRTEGEIDIVTRLGAKPTSERGQVGFSVPSLKLAADYDMDQNSSIYFQVQLAEIRSKDSKKQQLDLARAFYEWASGDESWVVRYGLIKNAYLDSNEYLLDYDVVPEFREFAYKYNYLPSADLGLEIHYYQNKYLDFSLGVFNGEENMQKEDGAQKDIFATVIYDDPNFHFSILGIRGAYDEYEKPYNNKERDLARLAWKGSWLEVGVEAMRSKELSNATVAYKRADGWDGAAYPELVVSGEGGSAWILLKFDTDLEFLARKDYLDPYKDVKDDEIYSENLALIIKNKLRSLMVGYSKTVLGSRHSNLAKEREFGFVGLRQIF